MSHTKSFQVLEKLSAIVFWGSIWGIIESSFGLVTNSIGMPYTDLMIFLISIPFLAIAYRQTGLRMSSVYIALVAAAIRCVPLPLVANHASILPAVLWILAEGVMMATFVTVAQLKPLPQGHSYVFKPILTTVMLTISVMMSIAIL